MNIIKIVSIVFDMVSYIIGILALYLFFGEETIIAINLMFLMYFTLFISGRLKMYEISKNGTWSLHQRS